MTSLRALALVLVPLPVLGVLGVLSGIAAGCSSSSTPAATPDGGPIDDAALADAPIGPLLCELPVPATCPMTAPCSFSAWGCTQSACEGYFVVTDGTWVYYYSSVGGALAGEVPAADAAFVACPYAFQPPASCPPAIASMCSQEAGSEEAGSQEGGAVADAGSTLDGSTAADGSSPADGASTSDAGTVVDGAVSADGGTSLDSAAGADGS